MAMEQFEKWFDEVHRKGRGCYYDCSCAWEEALEWVLLLGSDDDILYNKIKDELYGQTS